MSTVLARTALLAALLHVVSAQGNNPACIYRHAGRTYDFNRLNSEFGTNVTTNFGTAYLNPCNTSYSCTVGIGDLSSCCVQFPFGQGTVNCGESSGVTFTNNLSFSQNYAVGMVLPGGAICYPLDPSWKLQAQIAFACDATATGSGRITINPQLWNTTMCQLHYTWHTDLVCDLPPVPRPSIPIFDDGFGFGDTFCFVFFAAFAGYFFVGTIVKTAMPNAADRWYNNIPNKQFWRSLPGLVADGARFAVTFGSSATKAGGYEDVAGTVDTGKDYDAVAPQQEQDATAEVYDDSYDEDPDKQRQTTGW